MRWLTAATGVVAIAVAAWLVVRERRRDRARLGAGWWRSPAGILAVLLGNLVSVLLAAAGGWAIWYGLH